MNINAKQRELIKIYIFLFMVSLIIINWDGISWMFNYEEIYGLVGGFFNASENSGLVVSAANSIVSTNSIDPGVVRGFSPNNSLSIPIINVSTPVVLGESTNNTILQANLDKGAVYYPGSVTPGTNGQIVILGHSAPPNWPLIKHDYIFSDIGKLKLEDKIFLNFNDKQYTYKVIDRKIIEQGQDSGLGQLAKNHNILTLISCWPPGKNLQRIAVSAILVD